MRYKTSNNPCSSKWKDLFGDSSHPIATHLPFWAADNTGNDPSMLTYMRPLVGGWQNIVAKQYFTQDPTLGDKGKIQAAGCGTSVDLDSFDPAYQQLISSGGSGLGQPQPCKTTGDGLRYRTCPHVTANCVAMGQYSLGTLVDFICQTPGDPVTGNWNTKYVFPSEVSILFISNTPGR